MMENYLAIKNEITPFVATQMDPESIILNQRETNTVWSHSHAESKTKRKKKKPQKKKSDLWLQEAGSWGEEELDEGGQQIQTTSYKVSPRNAMYSARGRS